MKPKINKGRRNTTKRHKTDDRVKGKQKKKKQPFQKIIMIAM
jgi:hypothetical protein